MVREKTRLPALGLGKEAASEAGAWGPALSCPWPPAPPGCLPTGPHPLCPAVRAPAPHALALTAAQQPPQHLLPAHPTSVPGPIQSLQAQPILPCKFCCTDLGAVPCPAPTRSCRRT